MSTEELEARVRAATPSTPTDLDVGLLYERASMRRRSQRRRRTSTVAAVVAVLVIALVASVVVGRDGQEPTRRVDTDAPPPISWTQVPGVDGMASDVVTAHGLSVVVGTAGPSAAAVWTSTDGATWSRVYERPPSQVQICQPKYCTARDVQSQLQAVTYAAGRFVAIGSIDGAGGVQRGLAMTSTDGATWTEASGSSFAAARTPKNNLGTMIRDVEWFRGAFVLTGDVYTADRDQQSGLSPALWRSRDGTHWSRRILDLGDGFDPYMTGLTTKDGTLVASGGYEHGYGAWVTHDLRRWSFHLIEEHGGSSIVAVRDGFVASGVTCVPATVCGQRKPESTQRYQPTLWFSTDAEHWRVVLRVRSGQVPETHFGPVGLVGDTIVAVGTRTTGTTTPVYRPLVYASIDGRHWVNIRDPSVFPDGAVFAASGRRDASLLVFGVSSSLWIASP